MPTVTDRYTDPNRTLDHYARRCLVVCHRCGRCAVVEAGDSWSRDGFGARVTCPHCGFADVAGRTGVRPDPDYWLSWFVGYPMHPRCPRCGGSLDGPVRTAAPGIARPETGTVTCPAGGHKVEVALKWVAAQPRGVPSDPMFGLPLWLREPCCGETLWAFNAEHVADLRAYAGATLRERRSGASMVARLPRWLTSSKNRTAVLRALARLEERLAGCR